MIKAEWGSKRVCPKCATRFYDLGQDAPVRCITCGTAWAPEPVLKSKQPLSYDTPKPVAASETVVDAVLGDEDLDLEEPVAEDDAEDADLGGEDELAEVVDERHEEER